MTTVELTGVLLLLTSDTSDKHDLGGGLVPLIFNSSDNND